MGLRLRRLVQKWTGLRRAFVVMEMNFLVP